MNEALFILFILTNLVWAVVCIFTNLAWYALATKQNEEWADHNLELIERYYGELRHDNT